MASEKTFTFIFNSVLEEIENAVPDEARASYFCGRLKRYELEIRKCYAAINTSIKNSYMNDPTRPLDRHKCAACFMVAILDKLPVEERNLNKERLAIFLGMLILKIFVYLECKDNSDFGLIDFIDKNRGLAFPECDCDDEPYAHNWALGIHYDRKKNRLSALALSNILFLIEKYNRMFVEIECLRQT